MTRKSAEDNVVKEVETITIGDKIYTEDQITPSVYFDYVKSLKTKLDYDEYNIIVDTTLKMLQKAKRTKQTAMAKKLTAELELQLRELNAAKAGFDIYVPKTAIEQYIKAVEAKSIKIIELSKYEREIPDDVVEKLDKAGEIFDELYIVFTDYTKKETKKVAKHRREKDPIVFGGFKNKANMSNVFVEDRLFFIADWVEENCDLTLEQLCRDIKDKTDKDITYRVSVPEDEDTIKKMLDSFTKEKVEEAELEPVTLFEKIKKRVTRGRKKKEDTEEIAKAPAKKRGRPRKKKEE